VSGLAKPMARCVICGSNEVEHHHVGGRNHVAWFTMPVCRNHHTQLHGLLKASGIDLEYTPDSRERLLRALDANALFAWIVRKALREVND